MPETEHSVAAAGDTTMEKYVPKVTNSIWDKYYKENLSAQLDCKKTSKNLQEFYDCVNNP